MAKPALDPVYIANDNFLAFITKVNTAIEALRLEVVTANSNANGALTTGNAYVNGIFSANILAVAGTLRGGNVQGTTVLSIGSNVALSGDQLSVGNSTVNSLLTSSTIKFGNSTVNASLAVTGLIVGLSSLNNTILAVGSNAALNTSALFLGNSTVNTIINSTAINFGNLVITSSTVAFGNSTVNALANSTVFLFRSVTANVSVGSNGINFSNGTVNFNLSRPSSAQVSDGGYFLNANGNWAIVTSNTDTGPPLTSLSLVTSGTTAQLLDTYLLNDWRAVDYILTVKDNLANNVQVDRMFSYHFDGDIDYMFYGSLYNNTVVGTYHANTNATAVRVYFTPGVSTSTTVKYVRIPVEA